MSSERDRTRLVPCPVPLTESLWGRLTEIAAAPPGSSLSAVVRYLLDIGFQKWKPVHQHYRIEMREKIMKQTQIHIRLDQRQRIEEIMAMGYGRAVIVDLTCRLGDKWRPHGDRSEKVEAPNTGAVLPLPKASRQGSGTNDDRGAPLPGGEEEGVGGRIAELRSLLRSDDTDHDPADDSQEEESEFP